MHQPPDRLRSKGLQTLFQAREFVCAPSAPSASLNISMSESWDQSGQRLCTADLTPLDFFAHLLVFSFRFFIVVVVFARRGVGRQRVEPPRADRLRDVRPLIASLGSLRTPGTRCRSLRDSLDRAALAAQDLRSRARAAVGVRVQDDAQRNTKERSRRRHVSLTRFYTPYASQFRTTAQRKLAVVVCRRAHNDAQRRTTSSGISYGPAAFSLCTIHINLRSALSIFSAHGTDVWWQETPGVRTASKRSIRARRSCEATTADPGFTYIQDVALYPAKSIRSVRRHRYICQS